MSVLIAFLYIVAQSSIANTLDIQHGSELSPILKVSCLT